MSKTRNSSADSISSKSDTMNSSSSNSRSPAGTFRQGTGDRKNKFNEMERIDENAICVISAPTPDYGYGYSAGGGSLNGGDLGDDASEDLRLFPKRYPEWMITANMSNSYPSPSPGTSLSRSPRDLRNQSSNSDNKPLLINNGNISSVSGRNGATLNRISNANNSNGVGGKRTGNGTSVSNSNGNKHLHRYRRRRRGMESFQVIAFICGCFAGILLLMGLAASEWLIADGYRQGLFVYCVEKDTTNVPFVSGNAEQPTEGCHRIDLNYQGYTVVAAGFFLISLFVDLFATLLTALGLRCRDPNKKYKYYRTAVYVMAVALVLVLVALVVYPVCFSQIMEKSQRRVWEFGWSYGVGWGASIFLFGGVILLLCDKESEEIYYKERTIVQYADSNNKV